jgi:hypothetical protein
MNNLDKLSHENDALLFELEFWKSTALEQGVLENAYDNFWRDVELMLEEIDPHNTEVLHE